MAKDARKASKAMQHSKSENAPTIACVGTCLLMLLQGRSPPLAAPLQARLVGSHTAKPAQEGEYAMALA